MTDEEEHNQVRLRTEQNRHAVPASVVHALSSLSVSLDAVLNMSRQEFDALNLRLYELQVSDDERRHLIRFKHDSMTHAKNLSYFEPTDAEWDEIEKSRP
jgi:hypothetical protein